MSTATSILRRSVHAVALLLALTVMLPLGSTGADAKAGAGFSFGSRGTRTFSAPGFTRTAPGGAAPIQRSETPQPGGTMTGGAPSRGFGFGSGLAAGLLGAGLFGLLGGHGVGLLPLLLIGGLVWFALRALRGRTPGLAGGPMFRTGPAPGGPVPGYGSGLSQRAGTPPVAITPQDFDAFEAALVDVQTAYGREDMAALGRMVTPEMLRTFDRDIGANRARGVRNDVTEPRLLQGDLAESWREGPTDYATVAMRFGLRDVTVDRATGRVVAGDPTRPVESNELWTFRRDRGGPWLLSAIQQAR